MASTVHAPRDLRSNPSIAQKEGFLHYLAREGRIVLRWTIGICLVAVVVCMVSPLWMTAVVPAVILLGAYVLLLLANEVERRSDAQAHDVLERYERAVTADVTDDHAEDDQLPPVDAYIIKRESKTGLAILIGAMLVALLIAFIIFDLRLLAIGAFVVFAYMLLIAAPLWLGWFNDDIEDETRRLHNLPESPAVKEAD